MNVIKSHGITLTKGIGQYHIELVPMTDSHLPLLYEWNKKSDVLYWCEGDDVATNEPDDVDGIYGSISEKAYMFIITVNAQPIGDCWLQDLNLPELKRKHDQKNVKRIDITIYDKAFWSKGIGALTNSMLLEFGFLKCNVDMIYAITEDYNLRAQNCLLKSGFMLDLILGHNETSKGKSEYCFLINKQEYISKYTK